MKKILAFILTALMVLTLFCACNSDTAVEVEIGSETTAPAQTEPAETKDTEKEEDAPEPWKPPVLPPEDDEEKGDVVALTAPTTLSNGSKIELVSITDGTYTKPSDAKFGMYATKIENKTTCIFDNGATVDISGYAGFLVKKTPNGEGGGIYIRLRVMMADGTELELKSKDRAAYWYDTEGWSTVSGASSNWKLPLNKEGYVFFAFPFSEITAHGSSVIKDIQIYNSETNRSATFSEWSFVKVTEAVTPEQPGEGGGEGGEQGGSTSTIVAPTTLADGKTITVTSITDGVLKAAGASSSNALSGEFAGTTKTLFDNGATVDLNDYSGILFKATTSEETNNVGIRFRFKFKMQDGTTIEIKSAERGYAWWDGEKWTEVAGATTNWTTPNMPEGYVYLELPFSEITAHSTQVITDIQFISQSGANRLGSFSEFSLVKTA